MLHYEEITLVVSFLRKESQISLEALEERLLPVAEFFDRNRQTLGIIDYELQRPIFIHRNRGLKDGSDGLLYEAPFAEAKYAVKIQTDPKAKERKESPYIRIYEEWCRFPPDLDAWLSCGADQVLFNEDLSMREEVPLKNLSFGLIIDLTDFSSETNVKEEGTNATTAKATFHFVDKKLSIFVQSNHTCREYEDAPPKHKFEIKYSSIARAIVDLRGETTDLYLRLIHPAILYSVSRGNAANRVNVIPVRLVSGKCHKDVSDRELGRSNTVRMMWKNDGRKSLQVLHSFLISLQRAESVIASIRKISESSERMNRALAIMEKFHRDETIPYRARHAVFACTTISGDLYRQLAILEENRREAFFSQLKEFAFDEETHEVLESTMFSLSRAVDEGNVVMYEDAVPSQFRKFKRERQRKTFGEEKLAQGMVLVYKVFLTPSRTILRPPEEQCGNRILRRVNPDFMLSVAFRDDDLSSMNHNLRGPLGKPFLQRTVRMFLRGGLPILERLYEYLASSSSKLREHSFWFYAKDDQGRTRSSIREGMGSFSGIRNVGKRMAREGMCFSSTTETVMIPADECTVESDVTGGGYTFSDGVGKISTQLRDDISCSLDDTLKGRKPSAFQIRFKGVKGMVAVDPSLKGRRLVLRKSMVKFECPSDSSAALEVIKFSEPRSATLNRQIITILEQLGVPGEVFIRYQEAHIIDFADALIFESVASERLNASVRDDPDCIIDFSKFRGFGMSILRDPYFRSILISLYRNAMATLRSKTHIAIPWNLGRNLLGVMDETEKLEYGQVYIRITVRDDHSDPEDSFVDVPGSDQRTKVITGKVVVTKCPCVHPGDVRMLEAVDVPDLAHLVDVIVFPQKGPRPHPNEMAGSDLDGDEYVVLWDDSFLWGTCICDECKRSPRPDGNHEPMIFDDTSDKRQEKDDITLDDHPDFVCDFIMSDNKGMISNAHLAFADLEGIFSPRCISLAKKVSISLDFAKTGEHTKLAPGEKVKKYPDFMAKQDHRPSYRSQRALGELYRACRAYENTVCMTSVERGKKYFNPVFCLDDWESMKEQAIKFVRNYEQQLTKIMSRTGIKTEADFMVCVFNEPDKYATRNFHELEKKQQEVQRQRLCLTKRMKDYFNKLSEDDGDKRLRLASACYMIVYNPPDGEVYTHFDGAPWINFNLLADCRKLNDDKLVEDPGNCPLASDITNAIEADPTIHGDAGAHVQAMVKILDWAQEEGLLVGNRGLTVCENCLGLLYKQTPECMQEIERSAGAFVLLFIRFCAFDIEPEEMFARKDMNSRQEKTKVEKLHDNRCSMPNEGTRKAMLHRISIAAMRTYGNLAVSGDPCAIKGLSCGREHTENPSWSAKSLHRLVLDVWSTDIIDFLDDNQREIREILKTWCDAESDDRIYFDFKDPSGNDRVVVIVEATESVRYKLEDVIYKLEERELQRILAIELEGRQASKKADAQRRAVS